MKGTFWYSSIRPRLRAHLPLASLMVLAACEISPTTVSSEPDADSRYYGAEGRSLSWTNDAGASAPLASHHNSLIVNGGFEVNGGAGTSDFEGWSIYDEGMGSWFVKTGDAYDAPPPPEGSYGASTNQEGRGLHILYQDVELPPEGGVLSFQLILRTEVDIVAPESLDPDLFWNHQFRVDVIDPEGPLKTLEPLQAVYRSPEGPAYWDDYETFTADLAALGGQTVRIRFAQVDNRFYFRSTVDDVRLIPHGAHGEVVDDTPPVITATIEGTLGNEGWYTSDVTILWSVSDEESDFTSEGCEASVVTSDTDGVSFTCTATSAGGTSEETVTVKRDSQGPAIVFSGNAGSYGVDEMVSITCSVTDALSGVATAMCPGADAPAHAFAAGPNTLNAWAFDVAGNDGAASTTFVVQVTEEGLCALVEQHVGNRGVANSLCRQLATGAYGAFRNLLNAQAGKHVPADVAELLSGLAQQL